MGRHAAVDSAHPFARHAAPKMELDAPESIAVTDTNTGGIKHVPLTFAVLAMSGAAAAATLTAPTPQPKTGEISVVALEQPQIKRVAASAPAPKPAPARLAPASSSTARIYVVRSGDTMGAIAARYRVNLTSLLRSNGLTYRSIIYPGQKIRIGGSVARPVPAPVKPKPKPPVAGTAKQATIARAALAQVGWGQDCVAMAARALRSVGINYYVWPWQYYNIGRAVPMSQAVPGDLLYYRNGGGGLAHIAVYIGNGKAVHGGWNGNQTVVFSAYVGSGPNAIRV